MTKVHMIGNAHLDPVWLWQWQEGFSEIKATFKSALDRMREFDEFKFTSACGSYYMWIEQSDPKMFREIVQRVKEGRWCLVGGWFLQPDCNIPCGESFARHALITQRYFEEKFGFMAQTGYNVDSFGHAGTLPMILRNSRMKNYVFMRPMPHEKKLPANLFHWQSADGSRVATYRIPLTYHITEGRMEMFDAIAQIDEGTDQMAFYGIGNHGGGATVSLLDKMREALSDQFVYSTPDAFFDAQKKEGLPVVTDDLQYHAKGCYSAYSAIKAANRKAENALIAAEKFSILSHKLVNTPYPGAALEDAWKNVLFNQFHDILGGCSIREAYEDAAMFHGESLAIVSRTSNFALQQISWQIDTIGNHEVGTSVSEAQAEEIGKPLVVFNPLDHEVIAPIHVRRVFGSMTDSEGNPVPCQTIRASKTDRERKYARLFEARVPAFGYTVYHFFAADPAVAPENPFELTETTMSNGKLFVKFDPASGEILSLTDLVRGCELLQAPTRLDFVNDEANDTWAHAVERLGEKTTRPVQASIRLVESGPVRATMRVEQHFGASTLIRDYSLTATGDDLTIKTKVDFREPFSVLKFSLPVNVDNPRAFVKIPFGHIERPCDATEQVCGDWLCMTDVGGGLGIATDSKHSFDADGSTLSLTVLRNALFADHFGQEHRDEFCEFTEMGIHRFTYSVFPHTGFADANRRAEELQNPLLLVYETFHRGPLPTKFEGVSVSATNVSITAIKCHEDSDGVILRCYETDGRDTDAIIRLFDTQVSVHLPHHAVKTYLIRDGLVTENDFIE